ncbi:MAG TPA: hypothetical protein EYP04_10595 [Anaerolineae bacterium]|nr:hypothetical protein [Anaerolineae bacterium]
MERINSLSFLRRAQRYVRRGETWTLRKVLRRMAWHDRDHTAHILQILSQYRSLQGPPPIASVRPRFVGE